MTRKPLIAGISCDKSVYPISIVSPQYADSVTMTQEIITCVVQ